VLAHIKKLDDCFGMFLVRVSCPCGASREIEPEALAHLGRLVSDARGACAAAALFALREEGRKGRRGGETQAAGYRASPSGLLMLCRLLHTKLIVGRIPPVAAPYGASTSSAAR